MGGSKGTVGVAGEGVARRPAPSIFERKRVAPVRDGFITIRVARGLAVIDGEAT